MEFEAVSIKVEPEVELSKPEAIKELELREPLYRLRKRKGLPQKYDYENKELQSESDKPLQGQVRSLKKISKKRQLELEEKMKDASKKQSNDDIQNDSDSSWGKGETEYMPKVRRKPTHLCTLCPMTFTRFMDLERHLFRHTGIRNYACKDCGVKFITTNDLNKHRQSHSTAANFPCLQCSDKQFRTIMSLRAHMKLCHSDKERTKHLCTDCGATFNAGSTLWMHRRRIHSNIRNFKCTMCDKGFVKQMELDGHMKSHSNERDFKCDLCPAEYKKRMTLLVHKTKKHGIGNHERGRIKNQACPYCEERFALREKLDFHICRDHTGVRPFQCSLCPMQFMRKGYVKEHLKRKHQVSLEDIFIGDHYTFNAMAINANMPTRIAGDKDAAKIIKRGSLDVII